MDEETDELLEGLSLRLSCMERNGELIPAGLTTWVWAGSLERDWRLCNQHLRKRVVFLNTGEIVELN